MKINKTIAKLPFQHFVSLFLLILFTATPALVLAGEYGTVTTKDSLVYKDVYISANYDLSILELSKGYKKYTISIVNVAEIIDRDGNNISSSILEKSQSKTIEQSVSIEVKNISTSNYRNYPLGIGGFLIGTTPSGDIFTGNSGGFGYGFTVLIPVPKKKSIRFLGVKNDHTSKIIGALQYNSNFNDFIVNKSLTYGYFGFGLISQSNSFKISNPKILISAGAGYYKVISSLSGIDISGNLDLFGSGLGGENNAYGIQVELRIGLLFQVNK